MKKFFTIISLLLATLVGLALPATGHAASWGDRDGQWNSRIGTFTATSDDTIKLNDFSTWDSYPADEWTKGDGFNYHLAKFTVDDNNAYGWIEMQNPDRDGYKGSWQVIQPNSYRLTVNGKLYYVNLVVGTSNNSYGGYSLQKGQGEYVTVQITDPNDGWYSNYIQKGAYVYRNKDGIEEMTFAIPFKAIGRHGVTVDKATSWNFNQTDQLNNGKGINYQGASSAPWGLVAIAVLCAGGGLGWFGLKHKKGVRHALAC